MTCPIFVPQLCTTREGFLNHFRCFPWQGNVHFLSEKKNKKKKTVLYWPVRNYKTGTWEKVQLLKLLRPKEAKQKANKTKQASFISVTFLAQTNLLRIKKLLCFALVLAPFLFLFSHETKAMKVFQ